MVAVAIDGPSGAGKSTLSRKAAEQLGYIYVDTGALYRSIGLFAMQQNINFSDEGQLTSRLGEINLDLRYVEGVQRVFLNGQDVSEEIRSPEISIAASKVSAIPEVRKLLLGLQRDIAGKNNVVMDGRDIGTVILPDAQVKIFLTASLETRAKRRWNEYVAKGEKVSYNTILEDMRKRDYQDENRAVSPLRKAQDAVLLDTSDYNFEQSLQLILDTVKECSGQ